MTKILFTLLAALSLTGCPFERTNPDYLDPLTWQASPNDPPPRVREPVEELPDPELPDPVETPEVPPEACEGPECEPEVVPEDVVPEMHPACQADPAFAEGVTFPERTFHWVGGPIPFSVQFRVQDEADCAKYTLGAIDHIALIDRDEFMEPDDLHQFDPATGEGTWLGTRYQQMPSVRWFVYVPVIDVESGATVAEVEVALGY